MKRHLSRIAFVTLMSGMLGALAGCEVLGVAADMVAPSKDKAVFHLVDRATLILVDDPANRLGNGALTDQIAAMIEYELEQHKTVTQFVPIREMQQLAQERGRAFDVMSLQDIGKALHAEQVLHVHIEQVDVTSEPGIVRPKAWLRVKVLDVATGRRLFPEAAHAAAGPSAGYEFQTEMRQSIRPAQSDADRVLLFRRFADHLGQEIANLFYDHMPRKVGYLGDELLQAR